MRGLTLNSAYPRIGLLRWLLGHLLFPSESCEERRKAILTLHLQHLPKLHPDSVYPANWTGDVNEDKAGYISLEKSEVYTATARGGLELAGLGDVVKVSVCDIRWAPR
jgi:hypothetical protein